MEGGRRARPTERVSLTAVPPKTAGLRPRGRTKVPLVGTARAGGRGPAGATCARPRPVRPAPGRSSSPGSSSPSAVGCTTNRHPRGGTPMARPDKVTAVAEIAEKFRGSSASVVTEYRGLSMAQLTTLRRSLGDGTTYRVAKNTLVQRAAADAGVEGLEQMLVGPTAIAFI